MPEYAYTARDRSGRPVQGTVVADNSALAVGRVRELGYEVERVRSIEVRSAAGPARRFVENVVLPVSSGVPLVALATFYRQFATLIDAGIPLYQSLVTLQSQTRNPRLAGILRDAQRHVLEGGKLSEALAAYPWVFSELQLEMVRAAEQGGLLDQMLSRIADYLEQEIALRRLITRLTLYPKLVLVIAFLILGKSFFTSFTPALSRLLIGMIAGPNVAGAYGVVDYLLDTVVFLGVVLLVGFGAVAFSRVFLFQSSTARESYERLKMSIPVLGTTIKGFAMAKFGRAFAALYAAGMPLTTAIRVSGSASGSSLIARGAARAMEAASRGAVLSQAFAETGVFPNMVLDMLRTGEQTGNVDAMMNKVAEYLEGDAEARAHKAATVFAAVVMLLVAALVAIAVVMFYMNYFTGAMGGAAASAGGGLGE